MATIAGVLLALTGGPCPVAGLASSRQLHRTSMHDLAPLAEDVVKALADIELMQHNSSRHLLPSAVGAHCQGDSWRHANVLLGHSPWLMLRCWRSATKQLAPAGKQLSLLSVSMQTPAPTPSSQPADTDYPVDDILVLPLLHWDVYTCLGVLIFVLSVAFTIAGLRDVHRFFMILARSMAEGKARKHLSSGDGPDLAILVLAGGTGESTSAKIDEPEPQDEDEVPAKWSLLGIVGLCSLRFYTGFLSATWLPYLLAMEGQELFGEKQALFMAMAKLIFGLSILLNPIFGFIGDRAVSLSHGIGRRLFLRAGVTLASLGIFICVLAGRERAFLTFLFGIFVWRLGEALNDVTTEALVPEMIPQEQFEAASAIKAGLTLVGGLFGYVVLIFFSDLTYSWLYYAYPFGMLLCVLPSIWLLDRERAIPNKKKADEAMVEKSFQESLYQAYIDPAKYKGGFPSASFAVFLFGLGTSPMFFLLLIVRDLVGIEDPVLAQRQFSWGSICFFLAAAVACAVAAVLDPSKKSAHRQVEERQQGNTDGEAMKTRTNFLNIAMICCGTIVTLLPTCSAWQAIENRNNSFMLLSTLFGASFGISFSLFQDLTWKTMPPDGNVACAMGFNVMCRLSGIGLGNCICGIILDLSYTGGRNSFGDQVYGIGGYVIMCSLSGLMMFCATAVARNGLTYAVALLDEEQKTKALHEQKVASTAVCDAGQD